VPTYSYACTECGDEFDIVQSMTEDSLTQCPKCTGRLRKLFGNVGVMFKGSGFYRTDSRSGSGSGKASGSGEGSGGSSTSSTTTSATAPTTSSSSAAPSSSSSGSTGGGSTSAA